MELETSHPASFRDPDGVVFEVDGRIVRRLRRTTAEAYRVLRDRGCLTALEDKGLLLPTRVLQDTGPGGEVLLEQDRVPFVSYPFEWSFSMLKEAALLHLTVLRSVVECGGAMKDGSAYNVQWVGCRARFIDLGSLEMWRDRPWSGYTQFCRTLLNPLLLASLRGVTYRPWLRGRVDGIEPQEIKRLLSPWQRIRPGVLRHVVLQSWLQQSTPVAGDTAGVIDRRRQVALLDNLQRLVESLKPPHQGSAWADYESTNSYFPADLAQKEAFVADAVPTGARVWDLGANLGRFSVVAARRAEYVVALEQDEAVSDLAFRRLRTSSTNILPLVCDIADPSPAQGWRQGSTATLSERGTPDVLLVLALLHHLRVSANIPVREFIEWAASLAHTVVLEFIPREDERMKQLLRGRDDVYFDYSRESVEAELAKHFVIHRSLALSSGRTLYQLTRRKGAAPSGR